MKTMSMLFHLSRLLHPWRCWYPPLQKLLFGLVHSLIPSDDPRHGRLGHPGQADGYLDRFRHGVPSDRGCQKPGIVFCSSAVLI